MPQVIQTFYAVLLLALPILAIVAFLVLLRIAGDVHAMRKATVNVAAATRGSTRILADDGPTRSRVQELVERRGRADAAVELAESLGIHGAEALQLVEAVVGPGSGADEPARAGRSAGGRNDPDGDRSPRAPG